MARTLKTDQSFFKSQMKMINQQERQKCRRIVSNEGGISTAHPYSNSETWCIRIVTGCSNGIRFRFNKFDLADNCRGDNVQLEWDGDSKFICQENSTGVGPEPVMILNFSSNSDGIGYGFDFEWSCEVAQTDLFGHMARSQISEVQSEVFDRLVLESESTEPSEPTFSPIVDLGAIVSLYGESNPEIELLDAPKNMGNMTEVSMTELFAPLGDHERGNKGKGATDSKNKGGVKTTEAPETTLMSPIDKPKDFVEAANQAVQSILDFDKSEISDSQLQRVERMEKNLVRLIEQISKGNDRNGKQRDCVMADHWGESNLMKLSQQNINIDKFRELLASYIDHRFGECRHSGLWAKKRAEKQFRRLQKMDLN